MASESSELVVRPIGVIHSPFKEQKGTPTQPRSAGDAAGYVELLPAYQGGLEDLQGFDRVWLIYWFDRACEVKLRVLPYRDNKEHGLFATRVPARVNPIGMSTVRLLGVEGNIVRVGEIDVLDGTPLLDIKPYVRDYDAYPEAKKGWLEDAQYGQGALNADDRFSRKLF